MNDKQDMREQMIQSTRIFLSQSMYLACAVINNKQMLNKNSDGSTDRGMTVAWHTTGSRPVEIRYQRRITNTHNDWQLQNNPCLEQPGKSCLKWKI